MSRIDDLIRNLCPDGVEHKLLKDLVRIKNGRDFKHLKQGDIPVYGSGGVISYVNESASEGPSVLIPRKGSLNKLYFVEGPFWTVDTIFYTEISSQLEPKYFYYYLQTLHLEKMNQAGGVPSLTQRTLNELHIPTPPILIQREIARVLDQFSQLKAELETELEAEREAHQHQFTYYRDHIVTGSQRVQLVPIKDIGELQRGRRFTRNDMVDDGIPAIHYGEIYTTYGHKTDSATSFVKEEIEPQLRFAQPGDVIIAAVGETVADVGTGVAWLGTTPVAYHDDSFALHHEQDPRYISHALRTSEYHRQKDRFVSRAKVKRLSSKGIEQIKIPLPTLDEQRRIADILDDFDALVNGLSSGLPAEIEARRKQYEYYRDRLLTFPEKK